MSYVSYSDINNLEEVSFIGGSTYYLDFKVYSDTGILVPSGSYELEWKLSPYGQKNYNSLIKTQSSYTSGGVTYGGGVINLNTDTKRVTLNEADTKSLSGKFVQQVVVYQENYTRQCSFTATVGQPLVANVASHGLSAGSVIYFTTSGKMPSPIIASQVYYVISDGRTSNSFKFSTSNGGSALTCTSTAQSGNHYVQKEGGQTLTFKPSQGVITIISNIVKP